MQQTLLALCAILVFSVYALNRHRADAHTERNAMGGEIELMVTEQARGVLARALSLPYDEADIGRDIARTDTVGLSGGAVPRNGRILGPDAGENAGDPRTFDDLDDWNGYAAQLFPSWNANPGSPTVTLNASVVVRYVNPVNPAATSTAPTLAKEVIVTVTEAQPAPGRAPATAVLRQIVTPATARP